GSAALAPGTNMHLRTSNLRSSFRWSALAGVAALLVACADSPPPPSQAKQAEAGVEQADDADNGDAKPSRKKASKKSKKKSKKKGHTYDGSEYEVVRDKSEFDAVDKMTLKLRKKQPIHFLGLPMRQI